MNPWAGLALCSVFFGLSCAGAGAQEAPAVPATSSAKALDDVEVGERQVDAAAGDCASACAGLGRMQLGRDALCKPVSPSCERAKERTKKAEASVASFCDPCGGS